MLSGMPRPRPAPADPLRPGSHPHLRRGERDPQLHRARGPGPRHRLAIESPDAVNTDFNLCEGDPGLRGHDAARRDARRSERLGPWRDGGWRPDVRDASL